MADSTFPSPPATEAVESLQAWAPRVLAASAYAKRMAQAAGHGAQAAAWLVAQAAQPWDAVRLVHEFDVELGAAGGEAAIAVALRRLRRRLLPALALRDAAGCAPLSEVVGAMTAFAELAVQRLLPVLADELAQRFGVPLGPEGAPQELLVVAMGKGGGGELNVSSDLDLVFV
ncbi:MAG: bifunctional glutamine synthetase adenylyltransferase/deadenyltransferase, partial [Burkholderiales bacterium]|nr:bifunctional glutamine synthetase adenylyltransferase/deadenyltransferase [Burkholderiales bacterium]